MIQGRDQQVRYTHFMQDTQDLESAVRSLAPTWGFYGQKDLEGLQLTVWQLERIEQRVADLKRHVERDVKREAALMAAATA
jgi:hypothetical protein